MNDAARLQAAAWLGTHALVLYTALSVLLVAVTLLSWRLLQPVAQSRPQVPAVAPSYGMRLLLGCALVGLGSAAFAWLAEELLDGRALSALDLAFTDALARAVPAGVVQAAALLTRLGDPSTLGVLGVAVGTALLLRRHAVLMLGWATALGGNGALNPALKQLFTRVRPLHAAEGASADGFSFPSGHSSGTVVAFGMLAYLGLRLLRPRWHLPVLLAAVLLAFSVGVSRVILRVHYASDVAAGFASGTAWLAICVTGIEFGRWLRHRATPGRQRTALPAPRRLQSQAPDPPTKTGRPVTPAHDHPNQFALLTQRRFAPFFWVQFLGAGNDNVFKFAFTVLVTYQLQVSWLPPTMAGLVIGALFILPFLLFSATSGQLADKYPKETVIRFVKSLEIAIMLLAGYGFMRHDVTVLLACVFLMGLHSTLFGPVKFAYLPQHLTERELTGGNGMVEMGTFVAILLGNVAGGLLISIPGVGATYVAAACLGLALLGRLLAQAVPSSPATDPGLRINWNPVTETWRNLKLAHENIVVYRSLLGISWMWFFGAVFLAQFPSFAHDVLHGDERVASLLLVVFSIGIGIGALLCEMLSKRHVEIGLVPLGAIGMSVFAIDLYFAARALPPASALTLAQFLSAPMHWRVLADLALLSLFAGIYSVPMYALIQIRSQPTHRARIIAANNILNALFMIVSSIGVGVLLSAGFSIPEVFLVVGLLNAVVAIYIFLVVPEYLLRFVAFMLTRGVYRLRVRGDEHIPVQGAAVLVCNHVSFIDAVVMMAVSPRPIRFLMDHRIFATPVLGWLFRLAKAIPIASQRDDPAAYERAFEQARAVLREGDLLGIFPEGGISRDGTLGEFKGGVMKILQGAPVPVVPMALQNLWGSYFSRAEGGVAMSKPFRRGLFSRVGLVAGPPLAASEVSPERLRERVAALLLS